MNLSDEIERLATLRDRGALTEDEFVRAKARLIDGTGPMAQGGDARNAFNALRRSSGDRWIGGVCGGIARATGVESWIWRLLFSVLVLFGGTGLLVYVLLWIFVPEEPVFGATPAPRT